MDIKQLGKTGEQATQDYLVAQGFTLLEHNYTKRTGEIDIIARKQDLLVFVEVKLRTKHYFDTSEVITPAKQHKIKLVAQEYLLRHPGLVDTVACRFDVALIEDNKLVYIADAFR